MALLLSDKAFEGMFKEHFNYLFNVVNKMIDNPPLAEDLVQEVFLKIWQRRQKVRIESSVKAYLTRAVINATLNHLEKNQVQLQQLNLEDGPKMAGHANTDDQLRHDELARQINEVIRTLPPKCQVIFTLSRFEGLSNQEIAEQMGITRKTVENQMGKALQRMRKSLGNYLDLLELAGIMTVISLLIVQII